MRDAWGPHTIREVSESPAPSPRIAARMRFASPAKFLEFYDKQLQANVVGLRHNEMVADGTHVLLSVQPPGDADPLQLQGRTVRVMPRPDGSIRLRVALEPDPEARRWLDAFVLGLRLGMEHGLPEPPEAGGESIIAESLASEMLPIAPEDEIRRRLSRLDTQTYYQLLGVARDVTLDGLQRVYHDLTRRFHPDLFFGLGTSELATDAGRLYRRINEAYAVLKDPRRRRLYDKGTSGPPHTWTLRLTEEAEQQAQRARRVRKGDTPVGQTYWTLAREVLEKARDQEVTIRPALRESARLLRIAMAFEPENDHFRHALDHVKYRLSVADDK